MSAETFQTNWQHNDDDDDVDEDLSQEQPRAIRGQGCEIRRITPTED